MARAREQAPPPAVEATSVLTAGPPPPAHAGPPVAMPVAMAAWAEEPPPPAYTHPADSDMAPVATGQPVPYDSASSGAPVVVEGKFACNDNYIQANIQVL
eukprot:5830451-Prymnesium_polylepis.1